MRTFLLALTLAATMVFPTSACPECAEGIRAEVRRGIFGAGFGFNLVATALPFGVFLGMTALIHSGASPGTWVVRFRSRWS